LACAWNTVSERLISFAAAPFPAPGNGAARGAAGFIRLSALRLSLAVRLGRKL